MKNLIVVIVGLIIAVGASSCSTQEKCWAYRESSPKYKYNNHKHRPSIAGAMNKHRAKLRY